MGETDGSKGLDQGAELTCLPQPPAALTGNLTLMKGCLLPCPPLADSPILPQPGLITHTHTHPS